MNINDTLKFLNVGLPDDIRSCQKSGNYAEAIRLIDFRLSQNNLPQCLRNSLSAHREIFLRIQSDFPYTVEDVLTQIRAELPDFTMEEFQSLMDQNYVRWIWLNGEKRLFSRTLSSIRVSTMILCSEAHTVP